MNNGRFQSAIIIIYIYIMKKINIDEFNKRLHLRNEHISVLTYINSRSECEVICHKCGRKWKTLGKDIMCRPYCSLCKIKPKLSDEEKKERFIAKAINKYGNKYDYSKVEYVNCKTKVCIICPIHGEFWQTPDKHLSKMYGCPKCGQYNSNLKRKKTQEYFLEKSKQVHFNKYDYSKTCYVNSHKKVKIICHEKDIFGNEHGEFFVEPIRHWNGTGCPKCGGTQKLTTDLFIAKAKLIFGEKYSYEKTVYNTTRDSVIITCPIHGDFKQIPNYHLCGNGCPMCNESHLEREVRLFLDLNSIIYDYQKRFEWLGRQSLDFYLPKHNIAIEYQGSQHFEKDKFYKDISITQERDKRKRELCCDNGVQLIYYLDKKYNKHVEDLGIPYFNDCESLLSFINDNFS